MLADDLACEGTRALGVPAKMSVDDVPLIGGDCRRSGLVDFGRDHGSSGGLVAVSATAGTGATEASGGGAFSSAFFAARLVALRSWRFLILARRFICFSRSRWRFAKVCGVLP